MIRQIVLATALITLAAAEVSSEAIDSDHCTASDANDCVVSYMEEVVVTASRTSKKLRNSPLSLSLINSEQLLHNTADGIAEILQDLPGISVSDSGQAGLKRIRIRGEESRRIAVLIDGQESTDHREVGVPLLIDPQMVERIEVVRGPVSVLYGAKALGGVVNIITKKGGDDPLQGYISSGYNSANDGVNSVVSAFGRVSDFGYRISLAANDQGERRTPAGTMENTRYDSDSIAINISRSSGNHHVELAYEDYRSAAEVYVEPEVRFTPPFLDFAIDAPKRDRRKSAIFYSMEPTNGLLGRVAANAYRQVSDRQFNTFPSMLLTVPPPGMQIDSSIYTESRLITDGALLQLDWQPSWKHYLVTGIQFNHDEVDQKRHKETRINLGAPGFEDIAEKASIATTAVFVQDDWQVADDWTLVAGLRNYWVKGSLDQTDRANLESGHLNDRHLIGSVSLLYAGLNDTVLRANVSQGYVYPSLLQLATGAYAGSRFINPSLNLTPETSDTAELGLRHQGTRWMIDATLFTSRAENYIDHLRCRSIDNCLTARDETYRNVGESKSFGVEIDLAYLPDSSAIKPYLNVGWLRQKNEVDALDSYKTGLPLWQGRFGSTFTGSYGGFELRGDLFLRVQSGSERLEMTGHGPAESSKSGWLTVNLDLGIALRDRYRLNIGLRNLTDRRYTAATENLFAEQRSIHAKVSLAL